MEFFGVFAVVWILFAITCAVIAGSKNRNPIAWAVLGVVGGIFALVAVAAMPALPVKG
jgi:multisubunit Na+/H+ antiporter MnhB subunit